MSKEVEERLRRWLSAEDWALLELFLQTPPSKIRDVIVRKVAEAEEG